MKKIIILITYISLCFNIYGSGITNKQQADKFIANYCVELVNGISNTKRRAETNNCSEFNCSFYFWCWMVYWVFNYNIIRIYLIGNKSIQKQIKENLRRLSKPDATQKILNEIIEIHES